MAEGEVTVYAGGGRGGGGGNGGGNTPRPGRHSAPIDRRTQALELAVATFESSQGLADVQTRLLLSRAEAFRLYIETGQTSIPPTP